MVLIPVECPNCQSIDVSRYGKQPNGEQRYRCNNAACPRVIFLLHYHDKGRLPEVKQQIVDMTLNGSGVRDIVRVLGVSSSTVIDVLRQKESDLVSVNESLLRSLDVEQIEVIVRKVEDAEIDEMWSFVGKKRQQRWLWHAIDHHTGKVLAYVLGQRKDTVFLRLKALLAPFGIKNFYTDDWGARVSRSNAPATGALG